MRLHFVKCLMIGALAIMPVGCEPRPVTDDDTTIIDQDRETIERERIEPPAQPADADVDVDIERDAAPEQPAEPPQDF